MLSMIHSNYLNAPVVTPIEPHLIFSMDDTTQYVFEGADINGDRWRLVSPHTHQNKGCRSNFCLDDGKNMGGLRVKNTFTFSADGSMAPFFVTMGGLTAEELSLEGCPSGLLLMKV